MPMAFDACKRLFPEDLSTCTSGTRWNFVIDLTLILKRRLWHR